MKILFVSNGLSIHTVRWVNALCSKGHSVHLCFCKNHAPKNEGAIDSRVTLHVLPFSAPFGYYLNRGALKRLYRTLKPDVLNVHYASGYGTLARRTKVPYLLSVWGSDVYDYPYQSKKNLSRIIKNLNSADYLISTSHCMANQVRRLLNDEKKTIGITPFGVDINLFKPLPSTPQPEQIIIGTVKSLTPKYGIKDSVSAFNLLISKIDNPSLKDKLIYEIYGTGEQRQELEDFVKELHLENKVFFKGYVKNNELPAVINRFKIFLVTSSSESFGVAAVEAMACGIPCVTSDVDGFMEVMDDGKTGYIAKKGNIEDIAEKLLTVLSCGKTEYKLLSNNCVNRVRTLYNFDYNVSEMESIYEKYGNANKSLNNEG